MFKLFCDRPYEEIKEFLPENNGSIILTTRHQKWPSGFKMLDIDVIDEEGSIVLIQSLIRRNVIETEKESAKELVKVLGYLPLALAQASAYIRQNQITITEYLEFYKNHEQKLLADNILPAGTNSLPVAINWDISLRAIAKEANEINQRPLTLDLLNACAYLAPERIPYNLLLTWLKESHSNLANPELVLPKLIGQLWQYSMIHREENGDITIHRLVQSAIRHQHKLALNKQNSDYPPLTLEWYKTLLKSAHTEFNCKTQVLEDEIRQKNLLPHLQMLLNHYQAIWQNNSEFLLAQVMNDVGTAFFLIGETKEAKLYYERTLPMLEQYYGKDNITAVSTLDYLGRTYRYLGNPQQAKTLHERALKIKEQHYGKNHIEVALTLDHLGRVYRYLGDPQQAKTLHERALKIKEQHYGKNHIEVALTLDHLGRVYNLWDIKGAKELHERALKVKEQYYGKDHLEVALTLYYLGRAYRYLGDPKKAKELHERALKIREQYYSENHVEIAFILDQLGGDYRYLGDIKQAKNHHERSLSILEKYYGKDHVEVAWILDQLGSDYKYLGDAKQAIDLHEQALKIKEQYYGINHLSTAETHTNLGSAYTVLNESEKGKVHLEKALSIREFYYGVDHPQIAETLIELGKTYKNLANIKQALTQLERALEIRRRYFGQDHHFTMEVKQEIARR